MPCRHVGSTSETWKNASGCLPAVLSALQLHALCSWYAWDPHSILCRWFRASRASTVARQGATARGGAESMYTIRLQQAPRQGASYASVAAGAAGSPAFGASGSGSSQPSPSSMLPQHGALAASAAAEEVDHITFSAGNPRVEHLVGRVSLFRHLHPQQGGSAGSAGSADPGHAEQQQMREQSGDAFSDEIEPAAQDDPGSPRSAAEATPYLPVRAIAAFLPHGAPCKLTMLHFQAGRSSSACFMSCPSE